MRKTAKLFSATISESVVKETTHVVMGTSKRTINLLKAVIHGAYVLSLQWVRLNDTVILFHFVMSCHS